MSGQRCEHGTSGIRGIRRRGSDVQCRVLGTRHVCSVIVMQFLADAILT